MLESVLVHSQPKNVKPKMGECKLRNGIKTENEKV
jgi:hypothetical protein